MMRKTIALLLAIVLLACPCLTADAVLGAPFSRIGDVRFYGGHQLEEIDLSALVGDPDTLADGSLFLCRVYDTLPEAIETWNYDRIANFEFTDSGSAVLADYPGASAPIEPGQYALFSPNGNLFDDVPYYSFSAQDYYRAASPRADALRLCRVGLPYFDGYTVTKADGETVYEIEMTLAPELAEFYDDYDPNVPIEIECKYGYDSNETFCTVQAHAKAYDRASGLLTVELLSRDGTPGTNFHNFCMDADDYGYVFKFTYFPGLFTCGAAQSAHAFRQISGKVIEGMPQRVFTQDSALGRLFAKLGGKLWSEKRVRRVGAMAALGLLALPVCAGFMHAVFSSVRAFDGNAVTAGLDAFRAYLKRVYETGPQG